MTENSVLSDLKKEEADLEQMMREVREKIAVEERKIHAKARQDILELMNKHNLSINDLQSSGAKVRSNSTKGRPVPVQFQGPDGQTWTGRGRAPKWVGENREAFRVQQSNAARAS